MVRKINAQEAMCVAADGIFGNSSAGQNIRDLGQGGCLPWSRG